MAAVRSLRVSVKPDSGSDRSDSGSDSGSEGDVREAEPMEVEDGEVEVEEPEEDPREPGEDVPVSRSLKELLPDTSRRYENKAGAFITGIDVNSKEAIERKEKRAQRFHFHGEQSAGQRNVCLDKELLKKAIPRLRMEAVHVTGVDDMSTQDVFGYFKEYPPAHIEWIDDASCNVVWLDEDTSMRALVNSSRMVEPVATETEPPGEPSKAQPGGASEEEEEGQVGEEPKQEAEPQDQPGAQEELPQAELASLLRNDLRAAIKPFKGNKLLLRFATHDDKKELGAARRSRYYMKYGNPNYGGMKGILSNSWKRRYHNRRIQRDVIKKKPLIGDSMGHTPPYTHRHSADLVNLPEEPIKEEEEEEDPEDRDEDMDSDDRVVEYRDRGERGGRPSGAGPVGAGPVGAGPRGGGGGRSPSPWSESDEMDYDLELKMISTPSPKKSKKMTMYADELDTHLKSIRNRIGPGGSRSKASPPPEVTDVRQLLEEKRQREAPPVATATASSARPTSGSVWVNGGAPRPPPPSRATPPPREPIRDVHRRLGVSGPSKERKTGGLWSRLGSSSSSSVDSAPPGRGPEAPPPGARGGRGPGEGAGPVEEEQDSRLQQVWGAMIRQKQHRLKKSRLDQLPSLQIEISRDSSEDSDN
ncbi:LOW QUALITY PROTEIN: nuclear cap-binding protein subunit 3 [Menidia menidia]